MHARACFVWGYKAFMMFEDQVVPDAPGAPIEWQIQTKVVENFVVNQETNEWTYYQQKFLSHCHTPKSMKSLGYRTNGYGSNMYSREKDYIRTRELSVRWNCFMVVERPNHYQSAMV